MYNLFSLLFSMWSFLLWSYKTMDWHRYFPHHRVHIWWYISLLPDRPGYPGYPDHPDCHRYILPSRHLLRVSHVLQNIHCYSAQNILPSYTRLYRLRLQCFRHFARWKMHISIIITIAAAVVSQVIKSRSIPLTDTITDLAVGINDAYGWVKRRFTLNIGKHTTGRCCI